MTGGYAGLPERPAGRDSGAVAAHGADGPFADDAAAGRRFGAGVMRTCRYVGRP